MARKGPLLTKPTIKVLAVLIESRDFEISGAEIARVTKLQSGTLYPILFRLDRARWLESRWEAVDPHTIGRPRRRLYRLTPLGAKSARAELRDLKSVIGGLAWA